MLHACTAQTLTNSFVNHEIRTHETTLTPTQAEQHSKHNELEPFTKMSPESPFSAVTIPYAFCPDS